LILAAEMTYSSLRFSALGFAALLMWCPVKAEATEYLANGSFETPVAPNNGNNFYASITGWNVYPSPFIVNPVNLVVPTASYANNPQATPTGGGRQYYDMNATGGIMAQTVTFPSAGIVSMSTWFSQRDFSQNLTGMIIRLKNSSGTVVASGTTQFFSTDPVSLWKLVAVNNFPVTAGTYTFEIVLDNYNNIDLASLDFAPITPNLEIIKSTNKTSPVVVGEVITYTYTVKNIGNVAMSGVKVTDVHNGYGPTPVPSGEILTNDVAPTGDSTDTVASNGIWDSLGVGDTLKFTANYTVTQQDVDLLQ
jgi:Domain of unknown function DUF11